MARSPFRLAGLLFLSVASWAHADASLVRGPDGIAYPDCRFAGLSLPPTSVFDRHYRIDRSTFDGTDISGRLQELLTEIHALADRTDGDRPAVLIEIDAGTYYLSEITTLAQENIVIRGAGSGLTELIFQCLDPRSAENADPEYVIILARDY